MYETGEGPFYEFVDAGVKKEALGIRKKDIADLLLGAEGFREDGDWLLGCFDFYTFGVISSLGLLCRPGAVHLEISRGGALRHQVEA